MESTKSYFDTWLKSQEQVFGSLNEMTRKFQQAFQGLGGNGPGMPGFGGFQDLYTSWTTSVMNALKGTETADMNLLRETITKTLTGSNAYAAPGGGAQAEAEGMERQLAQWRAEIDGLTAQQRAWQILRESVRDRRPVPPGGDGAPEKVVEGHPGPVRRAAPLT